ncbi:MAG: hypothetical protein PVG53_01050 [Holophagae bacterium]|jgi:hypothetical protein
MIRTTLVIGLIAAASIAVADPPDRIVVVMDASDRMSRTGPDGAPYHDIVGPALLSTLAATVADRPELQPGLRLAGGGTDGDAAPCRATRLVIPVEPPDRERWIDAVDGVEPGGVCPLVSATVAAVDDLGGDQAPARLVVITAGGDDCGDDIAEVGRVLAEHGGGVDIRVIGLGLDAATLDSFGGVPTRDVRDRDGLAQALEWALTDVAGAEASADAEPPAASISAHAAVPVAHDITVEWSGPEGPEDFVSLARPDTAGTDYLEWARVEAGTPLILTAPSDPGSYELRYVDGTTGDVLARAPIEVETIAVTLDVPPSATAGKRFTVSWTGPAAPGDMLTISRTEAPRHRILDWASTAVGSPATLAAPERPGRYEVRYMTGAGGDIAARAEIDITR